MYQGECFVLVRSSEWVLTLQADSHMHELRRTGTGFLIVLTLRRNLFQTSQAVTLTADAWCKGWLGG